MQTLQNQTLKNPQINCRSVTTRRPPGLKPESDKPDTLWVNAYIRVSTDYQANEGDSLEEQEAEIRRYCDLKRFKIHQLYIERGKSAGNTNRPEYQKLLADVREKKIQAVVVKKIDRLSRSLFDFEDLMTIFQNNHVEFISIKENFDTTNAMGTAMLRIALVFAQLEREQTSERLRDVFCYRASQGLYNGGARPFGYTNVNKELVPYPKERDTVELMVKKFLDLRSITKVAEFLNQAGLRNRDGQLWDKRRIQHILQNPIYTGKVKWYDRLYPGIHHPIVTDRQFGEMQSIFTLGARVMSKSGKSNALLKGLLFCGCCGKAMTPSYGTSKTKTKYFYYRCVSTNSSEKGAIRCVVKYVAFAALEKHVIDFLLTLSGADAMQRLENKLFKHNDAIEGELRQLREKGHDMRGHLDNVKAKKNQFLDALIVSQPGTADQKRIQDRLSELEGEETQLENTIYKAEFDLRHRREDIVNPANVKQELILFKVQHPTYAPDQLKARLTQLIAKVEYNAAQIRIYPKFLPWPEVIHPEGGHQR